MDDVREPAHAVSVTLAGKSFRVHAYDPDDILVLERRGGLDAEERRVISREGDVLGFDAEGELVVAEFFDARQEWERQGRLVRTLPDGTEIVSDDIGRLWAPADPA